VINEFNGKDRVFFGNMREKGREIAGECEITTIDYLTSHQNVSQRLHVMLGEVVTFHPFIR
jgi:hypothetical protein